jgi:type III secretory pathway component EscS
MTNNDLYAITLQALRTLFLGTLPVIIGVGLAGTLTSALQSAMAIKDAATLYAVKLLALVGVLYFFMPSFISSVVTLAEMAFR